MKEESKCFFRLYLGFIFAIAIATGPFALAQSPSITVTSPNGGECLPVLTAWSITWSMSGVHHADVYYSLTGLESDKQSIIHAIAGQTSYTWIVPSADSGTVKIFIYGHDTTGHTMIANDASNSAFSIRPSCTASPPVISNILAGNIGTSAANVTWNTDTSSDSRVEYGTAPGVYTLTSSARCDTGGNITSHCVNLTSLTAGRTYYYRVLSKDTLNQETQSVEQQFASLASGGIHIIETAPLPSNTPIVPESSATVLSGTVRLGSPQAVRLPVTLLGTSSLPQMDATLLSQMNATPAPLAESNGEGVHAFVFAWSDDGGYKETESQANGSYALTLSKGTTWHVSASRLANASLYQASTFALEVSNQSTTFTRDIILLPTATDIPEPVSVVVDPRKMNTVSVTSGLGISIPSGSIPVAGRISVDIRPDERVGGNADANVIGTVYDVEVRGIGGERITTFNTSLVITMPYTDAQVAFAGVSPQSLAIAWWNTVNKTWARLDSKIDTRTHSVSAAIGHLTRFALIAPADTQPPDAPQDVLVEEREGGLGISWINPVFDFHHVKIYRSAKKGELGTVIKNNLIQSTYTDFYNLESGAQVFYVVRAVDLAGNESANTAQTAPGNLPAYQKYPNGTLLRIAGDQRTWIIMNGYKRHVVRPQILGLYGHLKNAPVVEVSRAELDRYKLAAWVRYVNDARVYEVNDDATKHWLDMSAADFYRTGRRWEAVFVINKNELDLYAAGSNVLAAE